MYTHTDLKLFLDVVLRLIEDSSVDLLRDYGERIDCRPDGLLFTKSAGRLRTLCALVRCEASHKEVMSIVLLELLDRASRPRSGSPAREAPSGGQC